MRARQHAWHEAVSAYVQESASDAQSKAAKTNNNAKPTVHYIGRRQRAYKEILNAVKLSWNDGRRKSAVRASILNGFFGAPVVIARCHVVACERSGGRMNRTAMAQRTGMIESTRSAVW